MKKKMCRWLALLAKVVSCLALYFSICILITAADKVIAADLVGTGYLFLLLGSAFLIVQLMLALNATKSLFFEHHNGWVSIAMKLLAGLPLYLSLIVLAFFAEDIMSPLVVSTGYVLALAGILLFILQFTLAVYGIGSLMDKKEAAVQGLENK